ncbi:glycoside hydrolase domain-containing protein [Flagellimonas sp. 2504JD1-5]
MRLLHFSMCLSVLLGLLFLSSCNIRPKAKVLEKPIFQETKNPPEWLKLNVNEALPEGDWVTWTPTGKFSTSSLIKVPRYPRKYSPKELKENPALKDFKISLLDTQDTLKLTGVRNEQISAQLAFASRKGVSAIKVKVNDLMSLDGGILWEKNCQVRVVKYLPVARARSEYVWSPMMEEVIGEEVSGSMNPNVVADALVEGGLESLDPYTAQPFWFTFWIPKKTKPGIYKGSIFLEAAEFGERKYPLQIEIKNEIVPDSDEYAFHLELWTNPSAIAEYYKLNYWSETHWDYIEKYLEDYASRGGKTITTTIIHEPWHKPWLDDSTRSQTAFGYKSMVAWIKEKEGGWRFDYSIFDRYVKLSREVGIKGSINAYSLTPFLTKQKIPYWDEASESQKEIYLDVGDPDYAPTWEAFLTSFKNHLVQKGWYDETYLGFDEKPEEVLKTVMSVIKNSAPEFLERIVVAGHTEASSYADNLSISYMFFPGQPLEGKGKIPVDSALRQRQARGKATTFYLCAEPAHPNTLTFSPAVESQLIPWLALKYGTDGYLRWAYNNWTSDPFNAPVFLHTQGDDYYVYPGENGPISSIRWELLKEGIEDYELFRTIKDKGTASEETLQEAIEFATRNQDGRYKRTTDITQARELLLKSNDTSFLKTPKAQEMAHEK